MLENVTEYDDFDYKEYPKLFAENEFWMQVRRTVNGQPVDSSQIQMIFNKIISELDVKINDIILDIACGNGAITHLFSNISSLIFGVDNSEYLILIAKKYFESKNEHYILCDGYEFVVKNLNHIEFDKVFIYGSMSYFSRDYFINLINKLFQYKSIKKVFIGNIPNINKAHFFYKDKDDVFINNIIYKEKSKIGLWWDPVDLVQISNDIGWKANVTYMDINFYSNYYRFDLTLYK